MHFQSHDLCRMFFHFFYRSSKSYPFLLMENSGVPSPISAFWNRFLSKYSPVIFFQVDMLFSTHLNIVDDLYVQFLPSSISFNQRKKGRYTS
ncbi:hypothetical protein CW304_11920 [Bacillus sp. UFRGS-B20]|nr:hypothetical protein CW304_11920 [Bacillus sp. UFRGS-B20]